MHLVFRRICSSAVLLILLAVAVEPVGGDNTVRVIDLEELDRMLTTGSSRCAVVFMAAWCMPCIEELPAVNELYYKYRASGLHVLGLSLDYSGPQAMQPFIDQHKVGFPVFWVGEKAIKAYKIRGIPLILLVRNGEIADRIIGKRSKKDLDKRFADFLK